MTEEYSDIEVDLSDEDRNRLIELFVQRNLSGASQSVYNKSIVDNDIKDALFDTILNEMILRALTEEANRYKKDSPC